MRIVIISIFSLIYNIRFYAQGAFIRNAHTILARYDEEDGDVMVKCWGDYRPMGRLVRPVLTNNK